MSAASCLKGRLISLNVLLVYSLRAKTCQYLKAFLSSCMLIYNLEAKTCHKAYAGLEMTRTYFASLEFSCNCLWTSTKVFESCLLWQTSLIFHYCLPIVPHDDVPLIRINALWSKVSHSLVNHTQTFKQVHNLRVLHDTKLTFSTYSKFFLSSMPPPFWISF